MFEFYTGLFFADELQLPQSFGFAAVATGKALILVRGKRLIAGGFPTQVKLPLDGKAVLFLNGLTRVSGLNFIHPLRPFSLAQRLLAARSGDQRKTGAVRILEIFRALVLGRMGRMGVLDLHRRCTSCVQPMKLLHGKCYDLAAVGGLRHKKTNSFLALKLENTVQVLPTQCSESV